MTSMPQSLYVQYSKRLATLVSIAWIAFRLLTIAAAVYRPEITGALIDLQKGVDDVMIVSIGFYSGNSVAEKGILNYFKHRTMQRLDHDAVQNG